MKRSAFLAAFVLSQFPVLAQDTPPPPECTSEACRIGEIKFDPPTSSEPGVSDQHEDQVLHGVDQQQLLEQNSSSAQ